MSSLFLELLVLLVGLGVLLLDLWTAPERKRWLGYGAAAGLGIILLYSFTLDATIPRYAFGGTYVLDGFSLFFKRFFLLAAIIVMLMAVEFAPRIQAGVSEFYGLLVMALSGMMLAASANDFTVLFVAIELITVTFYVLTSFQRNRLKSLEAGIKYLILGALATAFTVYGIALVYGTSGTTGFEQLAKLSPSLLDRTPFLLGLFLVVIGLAFKIAAFPLQIWAPDVYEGSPTPTTAFLAVGSKAAGFVVLLRLLFFAVPEVAARWSGLFAVLAGVTILYGNLCAIPQRNLRRLLGFSSIAHAGYLLLGVTAMAADVRNPGPGGTAILYYLGGYLFTVLAAFTILCLVLQQMEADDVTALAGLNRRSPFLAATMTLAMVSLGGIPPLAGFFGKFLLIKAVAEQGATHPSYYWLIGIAIVGVVISLYYYFGVIRTIYWSKDPADLSPISVSLPLRVTLWGCVAAMFLLGIFPAPLVNWAERVVQGYTARNSVTAAR